MRFTWIYAFLVAASLVGASLTLDSMDRQGASLEYQAITPVFLRLDSDQWGLIGLGQTEVLKHLAYLALVYNLESAPEHPPIPASLNEFFQRITDVGIQNEYLYLLVCYNYLFDYRMPLGCMKVLAKADEVHPDSWRIPFTIGFLMTFRLNRPGEAASYFKRASAHDSAPEFLRNLALKLSTGQPIHIPPQELEYIERDMFDRSLLR